MNISKLLLVEDDILIREILIATLVDDGFEVTGAENGDEAIMELEVHSSLFKAVITDIRLGYGPDGWSVARRARELASDIPVIYISGDCAHKWPSQGVPESVVLEKPFAPTQLCTAISALITAVDSHRPA